MCLSLSYKRWNFPRNQAVDMNMPMWRGATCPVFCSIAQKSQPSYLKCLQNLLPKDTQKVSNSWGAKSKCKKILLWKNHYGWQGVTSSHTPSAFSILLRTNHQARLTEIVKVLTELDILPVLLMPSTGQLYTKMSHATTSIYSAVLPSHRLFSVDDPMKYPFLFL